MPLVDVTLLPTTLRRDQRLMGLDLGTKTIGLALSDVLRTIATPYQTLSRSKFTKDAEALITIIDKEDVGALVLGLPVSMDGSEGPRCQATRQFATNFMERRDLPIALWDERLSTAAVERILIGDADLTRKRRGQVVDRAAAAYILQGALDRINAG